MDDFKTKNLKATHHTDIGEYHSWLVDNSNRGEILGKFIYDEEIGEFIFIPSLRLLHDKTTYKLPAIKMYEIKELQELSIMLQEKYQ